MWINYHKRNVSEKYVPDKTTKTHIKKKRRRLLLLLLDVPPPPAQGDAPPGTSKWTNHIHLCSFAFNDFRNESYCFNLCNIPFLNQERVGNNMRQLSSCHRKWVLGPLFGHIGIGLLVHCLSGTQYSSLVTTNEQFLWVADLMGT